MEATEAMKAMADGISERYARMLHVNDPRTISDFKAIALAAIMETQEACAKLAVANDGYNDVTGTIIAGLIRAGEHYALAGER